VGGTFAVVLFEIVLPRVAPGIMQAASTAKGAEIFGSDPWGIPSIYPAFLISVGALIIVSLMTKAPEKEVLDKLFPEGK
jgi:hypothetical protein